MDKSLEDAENLPDPDELPEETADDLETALEHFRAKPAICKTHRSWRGTTGLDYSSSRCNNYYMGPTLEDHLSGVLRGAILDSGLSFKALERETGVLRQSLMKFVRGEQSLRLDIAGRLASYFNLELRAKRKGR
jgi:hypothetical protein